MVKWGNLLNLGQHHSYGWVNSYGAKSTPWGKTNSSISPTISKKKLNPCRFSDRRSFPSPVSFDFRFTFSICQKRPGRGLSMTRTGLEGITESICMVKSMTSTLAMKVKKWLKLERRIIRWYKMIMIHVFFVVVDSWNMIWGAHCWNFLKKSRNGPVERTWKDYVLVDDPSMDQVLQVRVGDGNVGDRNLILVLLFGLAEGFKLCVC